MRYPINEDEKAPKMFPVMVTAPRPTDFNCVGSSEVTEAYIVGEKEYRESPRTTKFNDVNP